MSGKDSVPQEMALHWSTLGSGVMGCPFQPKETLSSCPGELLWPKSPKPTPLQTQATPISGLSALGRAAAPLGGSTPTIQGHLAMNCAQCAGSCSSEEELSL